ncbi:hypothetical protein [Chryseobacterium sp. 3008163]|uniref:hypothetical protein n=1 Tax=Chryseobacterium sp. 3008163 TaxID=2478663 RepID=UPI000F0C377F|nr:hypothetical protein [Chryseobacterium sp. 3008163]AYN01009.1 hypothetical protein EAG08_12450 [Chryseobacterium sp. 3008163]
MKNYLFLILILMFSCEKNSAKTEVKSKDKTLDLKYEVLNQLISDELKDDSLIALNEKFTSNYVYNISLKKVYLQSKRNNGEPPPPPNLGVDLEYDSIFLQKDSAYYFQQQKEISNFKFNKNRIKQNLDFTNDDELYKISQIKSGNFWTEFDKRYENKCIRTFSVPFFNKNKTMCILQCSISCGPLDGGGNTSIYKKIKGKWIRIKTFDTWVS